MEGGKGVVNFSFTRLRVQLIIDAQSIFQHFLFEETIVKVFADYAIFFSWIFKILQISKNLRQPSNIDTPFNVL